LEGVNYGEAAHEMVVFFDEVQGKCSLLQRKGQRE